eukprot:1157631-Pelagomonas_calceolata.AAC.4
MPLLTNVTWYIYLTKGIKENRSPIAPSATQHSRCTSPHPFYTFMQSKEPVALYKALHRPCSHGGGAEICH